MSPGKLSALRIEIAKKKFHHGSTENTDNTAMAAGIVKHVWTVKDLLTA